MARRNHASASTVSGSIEYIRETLSKPGGVVNRNKNPPGDSPFDSFLDFVCDNEYWNRAWVTQEIVLGRRVYLLLLGRLFEFISVAAYFSQDEPPRQLSRLRPRVPSAVRRRRYPLLPLLGDLRGKQCARLHDCLFSILGLVDEGQRITVDYDRSLPLLALDVLHACGPNVCLCAILLVFQMLGVHDTNSSTDSDVDSDVGSDSPYLILPAQESADQLISAGGEDPCPYWQSTIARCYGPLAKSVKITARDHHDEDFDILCIPFSSPALAAKNGIGRRFELCDEAKSGCPATPVRIGVGSWNQREITGDASTYAQILSATLDMGAEGVFKINAFFRNLQDLREEIHARFKRLTAKTNPLYADSGPGRFEFLTQTFDSPLPLVYSSEHQSTV